MNGPCRRCGGSELVYLDAGATGEMVEDLRECARCGGSGEEPTGYQAARAVIDSPAVSPSSEEAIRRASDDNEFIDPEDLVW